MLPAASHDFLRNAMNSVLAQAIDEDGATKGNLQLVDRQSHRLLLFAQRGFDEAFVRTFASVAWDDNTACGRAFRNGARVVIPDITLDAAYEPYVPQALAAGYRAVQSTPMIDDTGQVVGVLSTHFPTPQSLTKKACRRLDAIARDALRHIALAGL